MKQLILLGLFFLSFIIFGAGALVVSPYYFYNKVIHNDYFNEWYGITNYDSKFLAPSKVIELKQEKLGNEDLWKRFHFMDVVLPLPVKNPFYFVAPILKYYPKNKRTELGLMLYGGDNRELFKIFFIQNQFFPNVMRGQKLFTLPLVKNHLKSIPVEKVWKDIFSVEIGDWNIDFTDMTYNLYLLHLRSKIIPENAVSYSLLEGTDTAIIVLESNNMDYKNELIMTRTRGLIYSFIIVTEKGNQESELMRYKMLKEVRFQGGSERLSSILYKEFKGLNYDDQIDHQGMLYLLSAWTHNKDRKELIQEMVVHLERGEKNQRQLEPLYQFSKAKYGTTFTRNLVKDVDLTDSVLLKRNVELEKQAEEEALRNQKIIVPEVKLTDEEEINLMLKRAKRKKKKSKRRMIID